MGNNSNPSKSTKGQSQLDSKSVEEVICQIPTSRNLQFEVFLFNRRKNTQMKNVVSLTSVKPVVRNSLSSLQKEVVKITIEKILCRLSQVELNFDQANFVLKEALRGFNNLVHYYGRSFIITDDMICLSQAEEIKVWLNADFAQNYIDEDLSEPISQIQMFAYLVNSICRNVEPAQDRELLMEVARMAEQRIGNLNQKSLEKLNKNYLQTVYQTIRLNEVQIENYRDSHVKSQIQIMRLSDENFSPQNKFQKSQDQNLYQLSPIQKPSSNNIKTSNARKTTKPSTHIDTQPNTQPFSQTERMPTYLDKQYTMQIQESQDDNVDVNATLKDRKNFNFSKNGKSYSIEQTAESHEKYCQTSKNKTSKAIFAKFTVDKLQKNQNITEMVPNFYKDKAITPKKKSTSKNFAQNPIIQQSKQPQIIRQSKQYQISTSQNKNSTNKKPAKYSIKLEIQTPNRQILPKVQLSFGYEKPKLTHRTQTSRNQHETSRKYRDSHRDKWQKKEDDISQFSNKSSRPIINLVNTDRKKKDRIIQQVNDDSPYEEHMKNFLLKSSVSQRGKIQLEISSPSEIYQQQKYQTTRHFLQAESPKKTAAVAKKLKQNNKYTIKSSEQIYQKNDECFKELIGTFSKYLEKYQQLNQKEAHSILKNSNFQ